MGSVLLSVLGIYYEHPLQSMIYFDGINNEEVLTFTYELYVLLRLITLFVYVISYIFTAVQHYVMNLLILRS